MPVNAVIPGIVQQGTTPTISIDGQEFGTKDGSPTFVLNGQSVAAKVLNPPGSPFELLEVQLTAAMTATAGNFKFQIVPPPASGLAPSEGPLIVEPSVGGIRGHHQPVRRRHGDHHHLRHEHRKRPDRQGAGRPGCGCRRWCGGPARPARAGPRSRVREPARDPQCTAGRCDRTDQRSRRPAGAPPAHPERDAGRPPDDPPGSARGFGDDYEKASGIDP